MDTYDFDKEQLLNDIMSLDVIKNSQSSDRLKFKVAGILSKYEIKKEQVAEFDSDLEEKIYIFISSKKLEGLSQRTLDGYKIELNMFTKNIHKKVCDINSNDIRLFLSRFDHLKMSIIGKKLSVLKSFFTWLHTEEIITKNPTTKLNPPKVEKRMPKTLTIEELELLRECCKTRRIRSLIEFMYSTGCRLSEIQQLNISDINFQDLSCKVIGKGNKERTVYLSFRAMYHLKKYLNSRQGDCEALFATERKNYRRLTCRGIQREIDKLAKSSNIGKKVSPHWFRRTMATLTLNNGCELVAVQELLGHESPETTLRYSRITEERKREQHKKYLVM